jgi:hypothetical protein
MREANGFKAIETERTRAVWQLSSKGMRRIEYLRWEPAKSPLTVELPRDLLLQLGWSDSRGVLYGSRRGEEVRIASLESRTDEEQEKIGVFASRIRGEVFLTDGDLAFLNRERVDLALVVAGRRAGFFVRERGGSIQTVRSHEEFSVVPAAPLAPLPLIKPRRKWAPAGALALAALPLAALAMFPQRAAQTPGSIEVRELEHQLRISWAPEQNAVLRIDDGGATIETPVRTGQSSVTYAPRSGEVEVTLTGLRNLSTNYKTSATNGPK